MAWKQECGKPSAWVQIQLSSYQFVPWANDSTLNFPSVSPGGIVRIKWTVRHSSSSEVPGSLRRSCV